MSEVAIIAASVVAGAIIGRWWSIALAIPLGILNAKTISLEGFSEFEVGVLTGIAAAIGLLIGTAVRKFATAGWGRRNDGVGR